MKDTIKKNIKIISSNNRFIKRKLSVFNKILYNNNVKLKRFDRVLKSNHIEITEHALLKYINLAAITCDGIVLKTCIKRTKYELINLCTNIILNSPINSMLDNHNIDIIFKNINTCHYIFSIDYIIIEIKNYTIINVKLKLEK